MAALTRVTGKGGAAVRTAGALAVLAALAAAGCGRGHAGPAPEDFGAVADFALTDQNGHGVRRSDFAGKPWVASFVFTRCNTVCPVVCGTMARLQDRLRDQADVALVSFSVDPEYDTPAVLRDYARRYKADPARWRFLTGDREQIYRLIRESFHVGVEPTGGNARTAGNEVTHSTKLAVVDRQGHVRGYFDGSPVDAGDDPVKGIAELIERLRREGA